MKNYYRPIWPLLKLITLASLFTDRLSAQTYDTNNVIVQTYAGAALSGYLDGQGQNAEFNAPSQIVSDTASNLYVWDSGNRVIRKLTPSGLTCNVTTFVGGGTQFQGFGTNVSLASYQQVASLNMDRSNTIWMVAYANGNWLLSIKTNGFVSIENFALPGMVGYNQIDLCFDSANNIYYTGTDHRIYRYNPDSAVAQVFAGSGQNAHLDGNGIFSSFYTPSALVCDAANNIYVLDYFSSTTTYLRKIDQSQNVTTLLTNNIPSGSPLAYPQYIDSNGNFICVNDVNGNASFVSKITPSLNVLLMAGTTASSTGGYTNGPGVLARFSDTASASASQGTIFVADENNNRIRQVSFNPQAQVLTGVNLSIATYAGVTITGPVNRTYQIQSSLDLLTWSNVAGIVLTSSPYVWVDPNPISRNKYYRALLLP